ncbi:MAG: HNH endonuclease [Anaerolineae bacterium]|nr:HNH endonuclease [Anaerolineae bacterium]
MPDAFSSYGFHVDHIIPVIRHGGSDQLENLAWACFRCNTTKAGDIASYDDDTDQLTPLYNPRTQTWSEHFEMDGPWIMGLTPVGRVTVRILEMNAEKQVNARQLLMDTNRW